MYKFEVDLPITTELMRDLVDSNDNDLPKWLLKDELPWLVWVRFNGIECVATVNIERSLKANRAMIDIFYCMTEALNDNVQKTVRFNPKSFQKSLLK